MKLKVILTLLLLGCFLQVFGGSGSDSKHLTFLDIPLNGKVAKFEKKMKKQGFTPYYRDSASVTLKGPYADTQCQLQILATTDIKKGVVWKTVVTLKPHTEWNSLEKEYDREVAAAIKKYGMPTQTFHSFSEPYVKGDYNEMRAVKEQKVDYICVFETDKGLILIEITPNAEVRISYEDAQNTALVK